LKRGALDSSFFWISVAGFTRRQHEKRKTISNRTWREEAGEDE
jgi:hypothetical protein